VRHQYGAPTLLQNVLKGWKKFLDTIVIRDLKRFVEWDVEVRADEYSFSFYI